MNKARLLACPSCLRHVRVTEDACPFCASGIPASFRDLPMPRPPARRLSRAALYAFGATTIGLATACSGSVTNIGGDAAPDGSGEEAGQPLYGGPTPAYGAPAPVPDASDEMVGVLYGLPGDAEPAPDAFGPDAITPAYGISGDAEPPFDAEPPPDADAMDGGIAAYGLPPMH
jgi:hypothetical protein